MSQASWQEVRAELLAALELTAQEQRERLAVLRAATPAVASEVEALLAAAKESADFLEAPAWERAGADTGSEAAPERVGPWRIEAEIGCGGMGTVYRAVRDDDQYQKQVAIKLVRGGMNAEFVLQRFKAERQILANLEHPNIARLVDGGTTEEGWPYFSMEYVEGQPIDRYCAALGLRERLELFRTVCAAVQYAHQRLVIHRDLKPSNIFVSADGVPKLLDFGIAKLLGADVAGSGEATATVWPLMTPEYASPEQVRGEAVTTASDVYSLGMLLYLLLARKRAYEIKTRAPEEVARVVCQQQPEKPSALADRPLSRQLAGDLDTIVLKAIRKEPARRYQTVGELSEDLRRYLAGLPVLARGDTVGYRAGKFVRRHKAAVVVAGLLVVSLLSGIAATVREARIAEANRARAERERQRAERRSRDAQHLANSLVFELHDAIADLPGATQPRALLLKRASEMLDTLAADAPDDPVLAEEVAAAYHKLAEVLGSPAQPNLGEREAALSAHRKGLAIRERLAADAPGDLSRQGRLVGSYIDMAHALQGPEAVEHARRALAIARRLVGLESGSEANQRLWARALYAEGSALVVNGDLPAAKTSFEKATVAFEALLDSAPKDGSRLRNVSMAHKRLAAILAKQRELPAALAHYRKVVAWDEARAAESPTSVEARYDLSISLVDFGWALARSGDQRGAIEQDQRALGIRETLVRTDAGNVLARGGLASVLARLGHASQDLGRHRDALAYCQRAEETLGPQTQNRDLLQSIYQVRSASYAALRRWDQALSCARTALQLGSASLASEPTNSSFRIRVAWEQLTLGRALLGLASRTERASGDTALRQEAAAAYREALRLATELQAAGALAGDDLPLIDEARAGLARCDGVQGSTADAAGAVRRR